MSRELKINSHSPEPENLPDGLREERKKSGGPENESEPDDQPSGS